MKYEKVSTNLNFVEREKKIENFWKENDIFQKTISSRENGEKIDVILYDKDPVQFIKNALSPAKEVNVTIKDETKKEALALADGSNLSLAIGKKGQNVKLASRLTHYKIEVKPSTVEE